MQQEYHPRPLENFPDKTSEQGLADVTRFRHYMERRRTIRSYTDAPVPRAIIEEAIRTAGTAPSGANQQPWHFVAVSDASVKRRIREAAEVEERAFYAGRAGARWLKDLAHLGTDANKPFLETAPWLIVVFQENYGLNLETGAKTKNYYVQESAGLASGFLLAALHEAGLATLTHTPSPMGFLREILGRPKNERAIMVVVAGYPAADATVPEIDKKGLAGISSWI